jgi:hypothetical protein
LAKCDRTYCARRHPPRGFFDSRGRSVERKFPQRVAPFSLPGRPDHLAAPAGDPTPQPSSMANEARTLRPRSRARRPVASPSSQNLVDQGDK